MGKNGNIWDVIRVLGVRSERDLIWQFLHCSPVPAIRQLHFEQCSPSLFEGYRNYGIEIVTGQLFSPLAKESGGEFDDLQPSSSGRNWDDAGEGGCGFRSGTRRTAC